MMAFSFCLVLLLIFFSPSFIFAENLNLTDQQKSGSCLNSSVLIMEELASANFSVVRINDTIEEARTIFEVQEVLVSKGRSADYSRVLALCEEIATIKLLAFELRDQIKVLEDFYKDSSNGINTSNIELVFFDIYKEMNNERYELVPELIEKAYSEIILAQSRATTLNVFYDATTRGLKRFLTERWKEILIGLFTLVFLFLILKKPIQKAMLLGDLRMVELRKQSLKDMITKNQDLYFNKGKMSEESFTIKNKKLAELIRDVERQISLIREQIYALENKKIKINGRKK